MVTETVLAPRARHSKACCVFVNSHLGLLHAGKRAAPDNLDAGASTAVHSTSMMASSSRPIHREAHRMTRRRLWPLWSRLARNARAASAPRSRSTK